jgi:hypothetical protein
MALSIDEIYDLLIWDEAYSEEEYAAREQRGISEACKLRNLYPFIMPFIVGKNSKRVWEPCAKVIASKSNEELVPYLNLLLEWLEDMNWPGAEIICNRLLFVPSEWMEAPLKICKKTAQEQKREFWLRNLSDFERGML